MGTEVQIDACLLDNASSLFECGAEVSEQLRFELNHTNWELDGKYGIAQQVRELNQISMEYDDAEATLLHSYKTCEEKMAACLENTAEYASCTECCFDPCFVTGK